MSDTPKTPTADEISRLFDYWYSADVMHGNVHRMRSTSRGLENIKDMDRFKAYVNFWLSGLYVVAEGYANMDLYDVRVDELVKMHIDSLRKFRNGTFHYQRNPDKQTQFFGNNQINWAEDLHEGFKLFLAEWAYFYINLEDEQHSA